MVDRGSQNLQNGGLSVVTPRGGQARASAPQSARESATRRPFQNMTVEEMEATLAPNPARKLAQRVQSNQTPQTARATLEENKQLIVSKQETKALARKNSREFVEKVLAQDRRTNEVDKAKEIEARQMKRELAQYYKAKIADKEKEKANSYQEKVEIGIQSQYFPFVEGETICKSREAKSAKMREEMRGFLQKQREDHPPRKDTLLSETGVDNRLVYPAMSSSGAAVDSMRHSQTDTLDASDEVAPHMARYPRFLSRAQEHMSRRLHDSHVRKALEEKVEQTKAELAALSSKRESEQQQWDDGMLVNDALRYDNGQNRAVERRRHADYLQNQMTERKARCKHDKAKRDAELPGYFGPDEKEAQPGKIHNVHCTDLIHQMEIDHQRRASSRNQRLRQERRLVDNCMAEMSQDRDKEREKTLQHRQVLTTTWKSQQKIKDAVQSIDAF